MMLFLGATMVSLTHSHFLFLKCHKFFINCFCLLFCFILLLPQQYTYINLIFLLLCSGKDFLVLGLGLVFLFFKRMKVLDIKTNERPSNKQDNVINDDCVLIFSLNTKFIPHHIYGVFFVVF